MTDRWSLIDRSTKPHPCSICSKSFTRSDLLKRHEALHPRNDDAREGNKVSKRRKGNQPKANIHDFHLSIHSESQAVPSHTTLVGPDSSLHDPQHITDNGASHSIQAAHCEFALSGSPEVIRTQHDSETVEATWRHVANLPFDFSFLLPPGLSVQESAMDDWFPGEFYSALNETGIGWGDAETSLNSTLSSNQWNMNRTWHEQRENSEQNSYQPTLSEPHMMREVKAAPPAAPIMVNTSQVSSPLNEASEEDRWPFAWNPRSRQILRTELVSIPDDDSLYLAHNPKYNISVDTYKAVIDWLDWTNDHRLVTSSTLHIPSLNATNLFIGLFFEHCHPQMPVIHLATLVMDEDLPPAILASMVVIGAIYSHQKHTRSFAIVLLDRVRRGLLMDMEYDNGLMREPMIIYAFLLLCHAGLWCGNKRSFELAESLRGSVVNLCRRKGFGNDFRQTPILNRDTGTAIDLETRWKDWVSDETHKRLCWAVYMLDCQFPTLLNLPSTISRSELSALECPCDEEFWQAPSEQHWKRLLGPASVPPSMSLATAVGPFIVPHIAGSTVPGNLHIGGVDWQSGLSPMKLNSWSQFLVLLVIHGQFYEYSQEIVLAGKICGDDISFGGRGTDCGLISNLEFPVDTADLIREMLRGPSGTAGWPIWKHLAKTKMQLLGKRLQTPILQRHMPSGCLY